jgi:signal transduction histidine kinase
MPGETDVVEITGQKTRLENIGSATAGIAHDINNHLTLILNHLELSDVTAAREAAGRCCALTSSLLSYCRGESLALRPLPVAAFLQAFIATLHLPPGVHCTLELEQPLPDIQAEPLALARVLGNLITNACDAMDNEGSILIRATQKSIEIRDSGPGIPATRIKRIFDPFYTTKGMRGTGLGLAIVRDIMRQHGGAATVRNEPGRGATFTLRFR